MRKQNSNPDQLDGNQWFCVSEFDIDYYTFVQNRYIPSYIVGGDICVVSQFLGMLYI